MRKKYQKIADWIINGCESPIQEVIYLLEKADDWYGYPDEEKTQIEKEYEDVLNVNKNKLEQNKK